jgi:hypothetical protein
MIILHSTSGRKSVKISNNNGYFNAAHVSDCGTNDERLIQMRSYVKEGAAIKFAHSLGCSLVEEKKR